jgi:hypothetical protein
VSLPSVDKGLLFYDAAVGQGEFYTVSNGGIRRTRLHNGWRSSWTQIVPGNFGGSSRSDLLFYDPTTSTGEFYTTDEDGKISLLRQYTNWRSSWTQIIPGNFGGNGFTDLLFYEGATGTAEFYTTDGAGNISLIKQYTNFRTSWNRIIPGNFGGNGFTDLLFYDKAGGVGEFYTTDGAGNITLLKSYTNWRTTWAQIVPGNFGGNGFTDLVFYDPTTSTGEFYTTNGQGGITLIRQFTNWRSSWTQIIPGDFGGDGWTDLLFYEAPSGTGEFYATNGQGGINLLRTYTDWRHSWNRILAANFSERSRCIKLHWKSLLPIDTTINTFIDQQTQAIGDLYATSSLTVVRGTTEDLSSNTNLSTLVSLDVGTCTMGSPSDEQKALANNRNNVGSGELVAYIVQNLIGGGGNLIGCASLPSDKPGVAVVPVTNAPWLTSHEVGHVLGLRHVCTFPSTSNPNPNPKCVFGGPLNDRLMFPVVDNFTNPPPDINSTEEATMLSSSLVKQC